MARPKKQIDANQVEQLAAIGCTMQEMAAVLGCHIDTLRDNYSDALEKGRNVGKTTLRSMQWNSAKKGSVPMLIWLGKQRLNQRDRLDLNSITPEQAAAILQADAGEEGE